MKLIIAGSRTLTDMDLISRSIDASGWREEIAEIVNGCARGVDQLAMQWAYQHKVRIKRFPADWKQYGKAAGPIRNREMADYADALIAIWDGESRGTANMIKEAEARELQVFVYDVRLVGDGRP